VVILAIGAALLFVRAQRVRQKEGAPLVKEVPLAVQTAIVREGQVVRTRHVLGTVIGGEETELAPQVMARVIAVNVREGDHVQVGQVLALLDDREFQDAVAAAKAAVAAAELAYQAQREATARDQKLYETRAIALEQWQRSQAAEAAAHAQLEAAKRQLDQAETRLGYCRIIAPTNGVVARRLADPGDLAVPGKPLLRLVKQDAVRVRASLPPEDFTRLRIGRRVAVKTEGTIINATVSRIFPAMGDTHLTTFECDVTNPPHGLVSGAAVGVDVEMSSGNGLVVPADALLEGDRGAWVFAVDRGVVRPVQVEVVERSLEEVAVKGDLNPGARVIVARPSRLMTLAAGQKVVEINQPEGGQQ